MKRHALLLLLWLWPAGLFAQKDDINNANQITSTPANARYEIVLSQWLRRQTFKLDRFTGKVWVKVVNGEGDLQIRGWQETPVEGRAAIQPSQHSHFQILLSGFMASDAFLIDNDSGQVWELVRDIEKLPNGEDDDRGYAWSKMKAN